MEKFGSGINIPDPQHCGAALRRKWIAYSYSLLILEKLVFLSEVGLSWKINFNFVNLCL
jgi:hypothetical protein